MTHQFSLTHYALLLGLSKAPSHGYKLTQQVELDSAGLLRLGPATLYTNLKQLASAHFIEPLPSDNPSRRINYRLTKKGWDRLRHESSLFHNLSRLSQERLRGA